MTHDELKAMLNDRFGRMYQIITTGGDVQVAQQILDELATQIEGLL